MESLKTPTLVLVAFLFLCKGITAINDRDCKAGIRLCLRSFVQEIRQEEITRSEICRDVGVFVHCILQLECDLSPMQKTQTFQFIEQQLAKKGHKCEEISKLKASHIRGRDSRPTETNAPIMNRNEPPPGYSKEFDRQTKEFFTTTPKTVRTSPESKRSPDMAGSTSYDHQDHNDPNHSLEPMSSRRSRTPQARPVAWSNWGPQSQSSKKSNSATRSVESNLRLVGFMLLPCPWVVRAYLLNYL